MPTKSPTRPKPDRKSHKPAPAQIVTSDALAKLPWLLHGFSMRPGGGSKVYGKPSLNLGFTTHDTRANVERNRETFLKALGVGKSNMQLVTLRQVHSDIIHCVTAATGASQKATLAGDGLITKTPGLLLAVLTADCFPVILVDTKLRAVGIFHAGWRGTLGRIVEKGVGEMHRWFGSEPKYLTAAIGPGIRGCCFEVGDEVREKFRARFSYADELFREHAETNEIHEKYPLLFLTARAPGHSELPKKIFLDLVEANRQQLLAVGVQARNISASDLCTSCRTDLLFSHRREKGMTGRMIGVAGIRG